MSGRRALLVLGMHRSGTSALTRVMNLCGAALPGVGVMDMLRYQTASANARQWSSDYGLSENAAERYRKRFFRTFGLKIVPWSPLDYMADRELVDGLMTKGPTPLSLGVHLAAGGRDE